MNKRQKSKFVRDLSKAVTKQILDRVGRSVADHRAPPLIAERRRVFLCYRAGHGASVAAVRCGNWRPGEDRFPAAAPSSS